jgi:O-methyltransferase
LKLSEWIDMVAPSALTSRETLEATYDLSVNLIHRKVPGDFVECGVYAGAQCAAMAKAIKDCGAKDRLVHLFDSFAGIPEAGPQDQPEIREKPAGESACSLETVKANMERWGIPEDLLSYHPRLFSEIMLGNGDFERGIAFLRLDGDLYSSTRDCMQFLRFVSQGGWVCVDDWNLEGCRKAVESIIIPAPIYWKVPTK